MSDREGHELVGVYRDQEAAEAARERVVEQGVDPADVRVDEPGDEVVSLRGEMREEVSQSFLSPQSGFILTKEMSKGTRFLVPVATVAAALLALPFGFIPFGDMVLWTRLATVAAVGGTAGAVFGFILGAGLAAKGPGEPLAAEKGTTVGVRTADPQVSEALAEESPIRVDTVAADAQAVSTVTTEEDHRPGGTAKGMASKLGPGDDDTEDDSQGG